MRPVDPDLLKEYVLKVWQYKQGEMVSLMIHLGDRLGLYRAMAGGEETTAGRLADRTGYAERWVREWLLGQAAAGLVVRSPEATYSLAPEAEQVLVDENALTFAAGAFIGGFHPDRIDDMAEAFRTGRGVTYESMGRSIARQIDRMNKPWVGEYLVSTVLPTIDGLVEKLESGAEVADIGCGGGISVRAVAERFPAAKVVGYEPSAHAIARAQRRVADLPNASVRQVVGEELPVGSRYDLVISLDCMHDVPLPDKVAAAIRRCIEDDGIWLIRDTKCSDVFEENLKNPMLAMQYGYSVSACLLSATSKEGAAGLGTLGFTPEVAESIAGEAGFSTFRVMVLEDDPIHLYYEVRP